MTNRERYPTSEGGIEVRHHFDDELDEIRSNLVELGEMVVGNVRNATTVIVENRLHDIESVVLADRPINELYRSTEALVFAVLALQQPVASDLRFLVASTRILYELERSGDLAVNLVRAVGRIDGIPPLVALQPVIIELGKASAAMFRRAIEAIATMNPDIGYSADEEDQVVDNLTEDLFGVVTDNQEQLGLEAAVALFRIGRFYERIADHAVNIAQEVTFMVTAEVVEDQYQ